MLQNRKMKWNYVSLIIKVQNSEWNESKLSSLFIDDIN
jgi:hypothetical protein